MTDINECDEGTNNCHQKADCQNTIGNYSCHCQTGFTGNGYSCEGILLKIQLTLRIYSVHF